MAIGASGLDEEVATARTALDAAGVALDGGRWPRSRSTPNRSGRSRSACARPSPTSSVTRARASAASRSSRTLDGVRLTIEDDGVGGEAAEGAGLSGMRARLAEIGGSWSATAGTARA